MWLSCTSDDENARPEETGFDPTSPYAFRPPEYNLPKDPPKYADLVTGSDNPAFQATASDIAPSTDAEDPVTSDTAAAGALSASADVSASDFTAELHETPPPLYEESEALHNAQLHSHNDQLAPVHAPATSDDTAQLPISPLSTTQYIPASGNDVTV